MENYTKLLKKLSQMMDEAKTQGEMNTIMKVVVWVEDEMKEYDKFMDLQYNEVEA